MLMHLSSEEKQQSNKNKANGLEAQQQSHDFRLIVQQNSWWLIKTERM